MKLPFTIYDLRFAICRKSVEFPVFNQQSSIVNHKFCRAFTLAELLTVLAIMGILAALVLPALKNFGHSDAMLAAGQQMVGDIGRARQLAISQRSTVYMVFLPTNFFDFPCSYNGNSYPTLLKGIDVMTPASDEQTAMTATTNLCSEQLTGYTFIAYGAVGDQPGQHQWHYLAPWQTLPDGTFIVTNKFATPPGVAVSSSAGTIAPPVFSLWNQAYPHSDQNTIYAFATNAIPFPTAVSPLVALPYIAFNYLGQLTFDGQNMADQHEYIPLARGSVLPAIDPATKALQFGPPQVSEIPAGNSTNIYNIIDIDPLTGRATLETPKMQ